MHLEEISQSGCVNSWDENFTENRLIGMLVFGYFAIPQSPFVFLHIPVVIIAEAAFREFNFNQRSKHSVEFIENLVIILSTTNATSVSPHGCKNEECLIHYLLIFFFLL
jgi:hypothetical protein